MAAIPMRFIGVATWRRPTQTPSRASRSRSIRLPAPFGKLKRVIEMQLVDPAHDRKVLGRNRPRLVIDGAAADVRRLRLPGEGEIAIAVDRRFALNMPALAIRNGSRPAILRPRAPSKKSFDQIHVLRQLSDLGVQALHILARKLFTSWRASSSHLGAQALHILARKLFTSTLDALASLLPLPRTPAAPSRSWPFHCVI